MKTLGNESEKVFLNLFELSEMFLFVLTLFLSNRASEDESKERERIEARQRQIRAEARKRRSEQEKKAAEQARAREVQREQALDERKRRLLVETERFREEVRQRKAVQQHEEAEPAVMIAAPVKKSSLEPDAPRPPRVVKGDTVMLGPPIPLWRFAELFCFCLSFNAKFWMRFPERKNRSNPQSVIQSAAFRTLLLHHQHQLLPLLILPLHFLCPCQVLLFHLWPLPPLIVPLPPRPQPYHPLSRLRKESVS